VLSHEQCPGKSLSIRRGRESHVLTPKEAPKSIGVAGYPPPSPRACQTKRVTGRGSVPIFISRSYWWVDNVQRAASLAETTKCGPGRTGETRKTKKANCCLQTPGTSLEQTSTSLYTFSLCSANPPLSPRRSRNHGSGEAGPHAGSSPHW
jgi:hypothetical protein